ncbi:hypothetical protein ACI3PL_13145, partial [Lacticaseibacillus paracasei]
IGRQWRQERDGIVCLYEFVSTNVIFCTFWVKACGQQAGCRVAKLADLLIWLFLHNSPSVDRFIL